MPHTPLVTAEPNAHSPLEDLLANKVPSRLIAATAGLALGGPVGALLGAASAPALEYLLKNGNERYLQSAHAVLADAVSEFGGDEHRLIAHLEEDSNRFDLAASAVAVAMDTLDQEKLTALRKVLASGLTDDALLDLAAVDVVTIRAIEAPHLRLLNVLDLARRVTPMVPSAQTLADLRRANPRWGAGIEPMLATLLRLGLVRELGRNAGYIASDYGQHVLHLVSGARQEKGEWVNFHTPRPSVEVKDQLELSLAAQFSIIGEEPDAGGLFAVGEVGPKRNLLLVRPNGYRDFEGSWAEIVDAVDSDDTIVQLEIHATDEALLQSMQAVTDLASVEATTLQWRSTSRARRRTTGKEQGRTGS